MNISKNAHMRAYLEELAQKAKLKAHTTQDGTKAILAFKNTPVALVTLTTAELTAEEKEVIVKNAAVIQQVVSLSGPEKEAVLKTMIKLRNPFTIDVELFYGVPQEVKARILHNIEQAELGLSTSPAVQPNTTLIVTMDKSAQRPTHLINDLKEYLVA